MRWFSKSWLYTGLLREDLAMQLVSLTPANVWVPASLGGKLDRADLRCGQRSFCFGSAACNTTRVHRVAALTCFFYKTALDGAKGPVCGLCRCEP